MELWIGAEVQDDVYDKHVAARRLLQERVNSRLKDADLRGAWVKWAFVSIIMRKADAYKEVARKDTKGQVIEFRLRIDHAQFKRATQPAANRMLLEALARCLDKMEGLGVLAEDVKVLRSVIDQVGGELA